MNGQDRVNLGMDNHDGEAAVMSVTDGGDIGLTVYGQAQRQMSFGMTPPDSTRGVRDTTNGLLLTRGAVVSHRIDVDTKRP